MVKTKNFKKNLGKGLLAGALALSLAVPTFAAVDTVQEDTLSAITYEGENDSYYDENIKNEQNVFDNEDNRGELFRAQLTFEGMDMSELNQYIDSQIQLIENRAIGSQSVTRGTTTLELQALWLAAAQAAKLAGYPCSAALIECSVLGVNYKETKGSGELFHDKIVKTNTYKKYIKKIKKGTYSTGIGYVLTHSKSENADLYYSLHSCTYTTRISNNQYKVSIYDLYDFDLMNYDSVFTGVVNNWAWLCQHTDVLHKINVNISFIA